MRKFLALLLAACMVIGCTGTVCGETSDQEEQPLLLQDLIGLWEFESASFLGRSITAEELSGSTGSSITMEFTSDGLMVEEIAGQTVMAFLSVRDDGSVEPPEDQTFRLEAGKLIYTVNGMTMVFVRSSRPSREDTAQVDDAMLGSWFFEQVVMSDEDHVEEVPLGIDMFPLVYGVPAPTLEVSKGGYAVMTFGDSKPIFGIEEWRLEEEKLVHTEHFDDGTVMTWYFVRTQPETALEDPPAYTPAMAATAEGKPADADSPDESAGTYSYHGAAWGMTKDEVKVLAGTEPFQEFETGTGHAVLAYQVQRDGFSFIDQYNFLPSGALYNIQIMAPDEDGSFYAAQKETYTALYGDPMPETGADIHSEDDPVAVMMAALIQSTGDSDFLGWRADDETVIIMSRHASTCYVEIRRYTDYFRFE